MSKKEFVEIQKILEELFQQRGLSISKIVVFGSHARTNAKEDSDIDMIVVSKDFRNKNLFERVDITAGIGRELVKKTKKPFDIVYYSDKEWDKGYSLTINVAKEEGLVIYG